ncbi:hypothetical protein OH491_27805 (plasmid) [Termitidicoccus mucosus]|uniref:hypothetical protein n=1 Tax=Termitidicoccus mucosus TaxID=1184151 RepID=UPI003183166E
MAEAFLLLGLLDLAENRHILDAFARKLSQVFDKLGILCAERIDFGLNLLVDDRFILGSGRSREFWLSFCAIGYLSFLKPSIGAGWTACQLAIKPGR